MPDRRPLRGLTAAALGAVLLSGCAGHARKAAPPAPRPMAPAPMPLAALGARLATALPGAAITIGTDAARATLPAATLFPPDGAALRDGAAATLEPLAWLLRECGTCTAEIVAYTDAIGTASQNQQSSELRATAIAAALRSAGIDGTRLAARGAGAGQPLAASDTPAHRQLNRRIEIFMRP